MRLLLLTPCTVSVWYGQNCVLSTRWDGERQIYHEPTGNLTPSNRDSQVSTLTNFRDPVHGQVASTTAQQATACTAVILVVLQNNTTARAGSEEVLPVVCGARVGVNLHLKHSRGWGSTTCYGLPLRPECQMERAICAAHGRWLIIQATICILQSEAASIVLHARLRRHMHDCNSE